MKELKTLKDLKTDSADLFCEAVSYEDLRKEAIKWVNNFGNEYNNIAKDILKYEFTRFFNLTEENLK
jgi:hypothetical protein